MLLFFNATCQSLLQGIVSGGPRLLTANIYKNIGKMLGQRSSRNSIPGPAVQDSPLLSLSQCKCTLTTPNVAYLCQDCRLVIWKVGRNGPAVQDIPLLSLSQCKCTLTPPNVAYLCLDWFLAVYPPSILLTYNLESWSAMHILARAVLPLD